MDWAQGMSYSHIMEQISCERFVGERGRPPLSRGERDGVGQGSERDRQRMEHDDSGFDNWYSTCGNVVHDNW